MKERNMYERASRPFSGDRRYGQSVVPHYPWPVDTIYDVALYSDVLLAMRRAKRTEIFRNGVELLEAEQTDSEITDSGEEVTIDEKKVDEERHTILRRIEKVNLNGQHVIDVMEEMENDYDIIDNAYSFFRYNYKLDRNGDIIQDQKELDEVFRLHPGTMGIVMNKKDEFGRDDDGNWLVCPPSDRSELFKVHYTDSEDKWYYNKTGERMYPAFYVQNERASDKFHFFEWEIFHMTRYFPNKRLGFSPVVSCWMKVRTLTMQDKYILDVYEKGRMKGMLMFNTSNTDSLESSWDNMQKRTLENPHIPPIMAVENMNGQNAKFAEYVNFMQSLDELSYKDQRDEFRRQIGFLFGVSPILQGDVSASGGLNNEGLQYTVTNRAVESAQEMHNRFLRRFVLALGYDGWTLKLRPSEEQDEMAKLQRQQQALQNGQLAAQLGLDAEYDDRTGEVVIKPGKIEQGSQDYGVDGYTPDDDGDQDNSGEPDRQDKNIKRVKAFGTGAHIVMPVSLIGKQVSVKEWVEADRLVEDYEPTGEGLEHIDEVYEEVLREHKKEIKKRGEEGFTGLKKLIGEEIGKFLKKYKRMPSEKEFKARMLKIRNNMSREMRSSAEKFYKSHYKKVLDKVGGELNLNLAFGKPDENAINVLLKQKVLAEAYAGLSKAVSDRLKDVFTKAYKEGSMSLKELTDEVSEVAGLADSRAETIARTETSKVSAAARINSYKQAYPDEEILVKHIGPDDGRTTDVSRRIKARTAKGVSWDEYVQIMEEESRKMIPDWTVDKTAPVSHPNTRHTFLKVNR